MVARRRIVLATAALLCGCATTTTPIADRAPPAASIAAMDTPDWHPVATPGDKGRVAGLDAAWAEGLEAARRGGFARALDRTGALVQRDAALDRPLPPPGRYQCRVVKLGARPAYAAFPPYFCFVAIEGRLTTLVKETGSERPSGRLWEDGGKRLMFLGSMILGRETAAPAYGADPTRDLAGVLERIGEFRWRLAIPRPRDRPGVDLVELVPFTGTITLPRS